MGLDVFIALRDSDGIYEVAAFANREEAVAQAYDWFRTAYDAEPEVEDDWDDYGDVPDELQASGYIIDGIEVRVYRTTIAGSLLLANGRGTA